MLETQLNIEVNYSTKNLSRSYDIIQRIDFIAFSTNQKAGNGYETDAGFIIHSICQQTRHLFSLLDFVSRQSA